jgi:hypothetical protein
MGPKPLEMHLHVKSIEERPKVVSLNYDEPDGEKLAHAQLLDGARALIEKHLPARKKVAKVKRRIARRAKKGGA